MSACSTCGSAPVGSHHQKLVVLRHPGRPERDVAFVGGIDLCHGRRDDAEHHGDPQPQPMAAVYGRHAALARRPAGAPRTGRRRRRDRVPGTVGGPAAADPQPDPPARRPAPPRRHAAPGPLPAQLPDAGPAGPTRRAAAAHLPGRRRRGYPFAPDGERSVARAYAKALAPGARADLRRGPVPVVARGRGALRRGPAVANPTCGSSRSCRTTRTRTARLVAAAATRRPARPRSSC